MVRFLATHDTQFEKRYSIITRKPSELAQSDNASDLFSEVLGFNTATTPSILRCLFVFLTKFRQIPRRYLKLGHWCSFPHILQIVITDHLTTVPCSLRHWQCHQEIIKKCIMKYEFLDELWKWKL